MNTKDILTSSVIILLMLFAFNGSQAQRVTNKADKINYAHFTVSCTDNKRVVVDWDVDVTSEVNYFELEKSADGVNFKTVAMVLGPDPTKTLPVYYSCFDRKSKSSKRTYYRVKHISTSGEEEVSDVKFLAKN
jgi:hypothetical protein